MSDDSRLPRYISDAARAALRTGSPTLPEWPARSDTQGWLRLAAQLNTAKAASTRPLATRLDVDVKRDDIDGVVVYRANPRGVDPRHLILDFHGGALAFFGGEENVRFEAAARALTTRCAVYAVDYRVPPHHPYPAALDDAVTAYRGLLESRAPADVIVLGDAGGANLAAALLLRAKDERLPMPAACILLTPELDLTEGGDTFSSLMALDSGMSGSLRPVSELYAGAADLSHPYVSPLFGDVSSFPPTFLQSGTRDVFLSSAAIMHRKLRKAGVRAELHVWEGMPHGGFGGLAPEDHELRTELQSFIASLAT